MTWLLHRGLGYGPPVWQRNYFEHIIRQEADCPSASWRKDVLWSAVPPMARQTLMALRSILHEERIRRFIEVNR